MFNNQPIRSKRAPAVRAAALATLLSAAIAHGHDGFTFQKTHSISLSSHFFAGSSLGTHPMSVAFDHGTAWIGGFNDSASPGVVGVLRLNDLLSTNPSTTALAGAGATLNVGPSRGFGQLAARSGAVYLASEGDGVSPSVIRRIDGLSGAQAWQVNNPAGARAFAMAIDPRGGASETGTPGVAGLRFMTQSPHGDPAGAFAMRLSDGAIVYGPGGMIGPAAADVHISAGQNADSPPTNRDLAFDQLGNLLLATGQTIGAASRAGDNSFVNFNVDPAAAGSTGVLRKQEALVNEHGIAATFIPGFHEDEPAPLMAVAMRAPTDSISFVAQDGSSQTGLDAREVFIRHVDGTLPDSGVQFSLRGDEDFLGAAYTGQAKDVLGGTDGHAGARHGGNPLLLVLSAADRRLDVYQVEPAWGVLNGDWDDPTRWNLGIIADGATQNARFSVAIFPTTVTLNSAKTTKLLKFDSVQPYTISGTGSLTTDAPAGQAAHISTTLGSHTVSVPVVAAKETNLRVSSSATLTLSGGISGAAVTKLGGGQADAKHVRTTALNVAEGTLRVLPNGGGDGVSKAGDLTIATTARLDLTNNGLIVESTPIAAVRAAIFTGRNGGDWAGNGLTSSAAALDPEHTAIGYATAGDLSVNEFMGQIVTGADTLVRYTRLGDANLNGATNIADFSLLAANFNTPGDWSDGDFTFDGNVGISDFAQLAGNFNQSVASAPQRASIPEPTVGFMLVCFGFCATRKRLPPSLVTASAS